MQRKCRSCGAVFTVGGECQDRCQLCVDGVPRSGRMVLGYTPPPTSVVEEVQTVEINDVELKFGECIECGNVFHQSRNGQQFCSAVCATKYKKRNKIKPKKRVKKEFKHKMACVICQTVYQTDDDDKIWCSFICKRIHQNKEQLNKQWGIK